MCERVLPCGCARGAGGQGAAHVQQPLPLEAPHGRQQAPPRAVAPGPGCLSSAPAAFLRRSPGGFCPPAGTGPHPAPGPRWAPGVR